MWNRRATNARDPGLLHRRDQERWTKHPGVRASPVFTIKVEARGTNDWMATICGLCGQSVEVGKERCVVCSQADPDLERFLVRVELPVLHVLSAMVGSHDR